MFEQCSVDAESDQMFAAVFTEIIEFLSLICVCSRMSSRVVLKYVPKMTRL